MTRVALLTEVPTPFRTPLFAALAERCDLTVLFVAASDPRRAYRIEDESMTFPHRVLAGTGLRRGAAWLVLNRGVARSLREADPEVVVVGGWGQPAYWRALFWARRRKLPVAAWVESTERDARAGSRFARRLKRAFVARCSGFLVPGRAAREHLERLGAPPASIVQAPNAVDLTRFRDRVAELRERREPNARPVVLTAARLAPEKGIDVLLEAARGLEADVEVAGRGPEAEALRAAAPPNVRFLGQLPQEDLAAAYARADVFVLPSRSEPWGMVLNEAAAAGLPIVATDAVGAAWDLVEDGENGFRVRVDDHSALRRALERLADPAFRVRAGSRSSELATRFTPAAWAAAVAGLAGRLAP